MSLHRTIQPDAVVSSATAVGGELGRQTSRILLADHDATSVMRTESMLAGWGYADVIATTEGEEVAELCDAVNPDIVLLDLDLRHPDGFELLQRLEGHARGATRLPILAFSADTSRGVWRRALAAGARDVIAKPFDPDELELRLASLLETRRLQLELQRQNLVLDHRVRARTRDLERSRLEALERLAAAAEFRDTSTYGHTARVGRTTAEIMSKLGADAEQVRLMRLAAPLHDVGNIGIPDSILLKAGALSADEFELMKQHTVIGAQILAGGSSPLLRTCEEIAATHHERWDGSGYPEGLRGEAIPISGRATALADVFDALTHRRPYKPAWTIDEALAQISKDRGTHFDPQLVDVFMTLDHRSLQEDLDPADDGVNP